MTIRRLATRLAASVPLAFGLLATLAGCVKPGPTPPPLQLTVASNGDATGTFTKGQTVSLTFKVTNPSHDAAGGVNLMASAVAPALQPLLVQSMTCTAQVGACPAGDGGWQSVSIAGGAVLDFTVTGTIEQNYDGAMDVQFLVDSSNFIGSSSAHAHVTLTDSRDGYYVLFGSSGRVANVTVSFKPGDLHWWVSSDDTPMPFTQDAGGYVFANGSRFVPGPDLLNGTYDFGAGPEGFVAIRQFESDLAALDGAAFTLFSATPSGTGTRAVTVQPAWIAGSTLTLCQDSVPRTAATCPATAQAHYAITQNGVTFIATGTDTFQFFVADTGTSRVLLRGDSNGSAGFFDIGLPPAAPSTLSQSLYGTTPGGWGNFVLDPGSYKTSAYQPSSNNFGAFTAAVALQDVAGGPTGLRQGTRGDGAAFELASSSALVVQTGGPAQIDLFAPWLF